jgi:hypothetical protein
MKRTALAALLLSSALSVSAFAASDVRFTGDLAIGGGSNRSSDSDLRDGGPLHLNGRGSLFIPFSNSKLSGTVDAFGEQGWNLIDDPGDEEDSLTYGVAGHFTFTQPGRYSLGVVGSLFQTDFTDHHNGSENEWFGLIGAEGKFMLERAAVFAQAGFIDLLDDCDSCRVDPFHEISFFRGGVNYYLEDDLKLTGEVGFYAGNNDDSSSYFKDELSLNIYKVELEQQVSSNFSVYGQYQFANFINEEDGDSLDQNSFLIGFRVRLGDGSTGTLRSHEATNSIGTPSIGQFIAVADEID